MSVRPTSSSVVSLRAFANNCGVPLAVLLELIPSHQLLVPQVNRSPAPPRCRLCRAFWSQYCMVNLSKKMWHCALCGTGNISKPALASPDPTAYPELYRDCVEYRVLHQEDLRSALPARKHVVVVVDATLDVALLANVRRALLGMLQEELKPDTFVSVISFDSSVAVFDLAGGRQQIPSVVLPGSVALDQGSQDTLHHPQHTFSAEYGSCAERVAAAVASVRPFETDKPMRLRSRCVGVAVEAGVALLNKTARLPLAEGTSEIPRLATGSRLLVFLGGPITKGPGAMPLSVVDGVEKPSKAHLKQAKDSEAHMTSIAAAAGRIGVAVDVFVGTGEGVNVPLLAHLVNESQGGQLHVQQGFGPSFGPALKACMSSCFGTRGTMDLFCSEGLRAVQCIGALDEQQKQHVSPAMPGPWLSPSACSIGPLVAGRGVVARFELTEDLPAPEPSKPLYAHIQVVLYYHDVQTSELVARVTSLRLDIVARAGQFLRSVDPQATAIVLSKRLALEAQAQGALSGEAKKLEVAQLAVAAQVALISSRLGKDVQVSSGILGIGARREKQWPPELLPLALALYNLQHSRMLLPQPLPPPHFVHPDERHMLMLRLLAAGSEAAAAQLLPKLYAILPVQQSPLSPQQGTADQKQATSPSQQGAGAKQPLPGTVSAKDAMHSNRASLTGHEEGVLVDVGAPLDIVGMAVLQTQQEQGSQSGPATLIPPLLLDTGPAQLLLPPPPRPATSPPTSVQPQTVSDPARLCIQHLCHAGREPQLLLVQRSSPAAAPDRAGHAPTIACSGFVSEAVGPQGCACVSEGVFVSMLQRVHADAWPQQQPQLEGQGSSLARLWVDNSDVAKRAGAEVAELLKGASPVPSFVQWGKGMGIAWVPASGGQGEQ